MTTTEGRVPVRRVLLLAVVADLLTVVLQPTLGRLRELESVHLRVVVAGGETRAFDVDAPDLATATAKAIRAVEQEGGIVVRVEVGEPRAARRVA